MARGSYTEAWRELQAILVSFYDDGDLRQLMRNVFDDPEMVSSLPGAGASTQELARSMVVLIQQFHAVPPASFWDYLGDSRRQRGLEIEGLRALFARLVNRPYLEPPAAASPGVAGIRLTEASSGSCDLLEVLGVVRSQRGADMPTCLDILMPGTVNGMRRVFALAWTARSLKIDATPSLYGEHERMPNRVELRLPIRQALLRYFPYGRNYYRNDQMPPEVLVAVDTWDEQVRRIVLGDCAGVQQFSIDFLFPGLSGGR